MPPQMSQVALGPQGGGVQGPTAAMNLIQQLAQNQQQQATKSMQAIVKMQQEAQMQAEAQAQQSASAVQDIANQVSGGMQKLHEERKQRKEKIEDTKIQEDMMVFQQELAEGSVKEAQRIGTMIKTSREAAMNAVNVWREKKDGMRTNIDAAWSKMNKDLASGKFEGRQGEADKIFQELRHAEALHEDAFDPAYTSGVAKQLADVERDIAEGRDPMDLAALYDKPSVQEYAVVNGSNKNPYIDGLTRYQMDLRDGWPKDGLMAMKVDDPIRGRVRTVTPDVVAKALLLNNDYTSLITDESRKIFFKAQLKSFDKGLTQLSRAAEAAEQVSTMFFARGPGAITEGYQAFLSDPRPNKFQNIGENLGLSVISKMAPEAGSQLVQLAMDIRDGTASMDTAGELAGALQIEAMAAATESYLKLIVSDINAGSLGKDKKGESQTNISELSKQWAAAQKPGYVAQLVGAGGVEKDGVTLTGTGLATVQFKMQEELGKAAVWAGELKRSAKKMGANKEFATQFGTDARLSEIMTFGWLAEKAEDRDKAKALLFGKGREALAEQSAAKWEGLSPADRARYARPTLGDIEDLQVTEGEGLRRNRTILDHYLQYVEHFSPHELPLLANLLAGGKMDLTDGNVKAFNAATESAEAGDEYMMLAKAKLMDYREIAKAAKKAQGEGTPWTPEQGLEVYKERAEGRKVLAKQLKQFKGDPKSQMDFWTQWVGTVAGIAAKNFQGNIERLEEIGQSVGSAVSRGVERTVGGIQTGFREATQPGGQ